MNNNQSFGFNWNEKASREIEDLESYYDLDIEPNKKKEWLYYNQSLKELRSKGYERHLMPWESFGLIIDYLEGNLSGNLETLVKDVLEGFGEWFDLFMERKDDKLFCYVPKVRLVPDDVEWNSTSLKYEVNENKLKIDKEFIIGDIPSEKAVDLEQFKKVKGFIKYIYNREFDELPEQMKTGHEKAQVYLHPKDVLRPIGRGHYYRGRFSIDFYNFRTPRGVRAKNYSLSQNK